MGAEVLGANLARLEDIDSLQAAFVRHLLLIFPEQSLDVLQQVAFSRCFGELQVHALDQYRHPQHPEIYVLSNVAADGKTTGSHPDRGTLVWHSDLSFQKRPAAATILYGIEVPRAGGDTLYADMYAAYETLDLETKKLLNGLKAVHDLDASRRRAGEPPMTPTQRAEAPPVEHPAVRTHPATKRKLLYISRHVSHFSGMRRQESDALLEHLMRHATEARFVFRHKWRPRTTARW
jgi:taurine dioxygenase